MTTQILVSIKFFAGTQKGIPFNTTVKASDLLVGTITEESSIEEVFSALDQKRVDSLMDFAFAGDNIAVTSKYKWEKQLIADTLQEQFRRLQIAKVREAEKTKGVVPPAPVQVVSAQQHQSEGAVATMTQPTTTTNETNNNKGAVTMNQETVSAGVAAELAVETKEFDKFNKMKVNAVVAGQRGYSEEAKNRLLASTGEYAVQVIGINWLPKPDQYGRVGKITFVVSADYMEVSVYNNLQKRFDWHDMAGYNLDGTQSFKKPVFGSGILMCYIKQTPQGLQVTMPKTKGKKENQYFDIVRTKDIRFKKAFGDNNHNLEAALSAFVQMMTGEFVQSNPENRMGFNEHCGNCRYMQYMAIHDGLEEEHENKISGKDVMSLAQDGQYNEQWICTVSRQFVDTEGVFELNEAMTYDQTTYHNEEGVLTYLRAGQILIGGKPMYVRDVRAEGTKPTCQSCPFYHKSEKKPEARVSAEKARAAEGKYVSKYWTERAEARRQPVQTLVKSASGMEWVAKFPGEVKDPQEFRVMGIGGVNVYGSGDMMAAADGDFVAPIEPINVAEKNANYIINLVHSVCNNFEDIEEDALNILMGMINDKPQGLQRGTENRWDGAVKRLVETIKEYQNM